MKYLVFIILSSFWATAANANKIDKLKTDEDVEKFMITEGKLNKHFHVRSLENMYEDDEELQLAKKLGVKNWQKRDLNNDGRTDLLVYIGETIDYHTIVVIDDGGQFKLQYFGKMFSVHYPVIGMWNGKLCIRIFTEAYQFYSNNKKVHIIGDTAVLVYQFGSFMEPKKVNNGYHIEKIQYQTTGCYGSCPIFKLEIDSNRLAIYHATQYNKKQGVFKTKIDKANYDLVVSNLCYIDFPALENNYAVGWTDDEKGILIITYDHGKVKKISDYGLQGSYGLRAVYSKLSQLRDNQNWKVAKD